MKNHHNEELTKNSEENKTRIKKFNDNIKKEIDEEQRKRQIEEQKRLQKIEEINKIIMMKQKSKEKRKLK